MAPFHPDNKTEIKTIQEKIFIEFPYFGFEPQPELTPDMAKLICDQLSLENETIEVPMVHGLWCMDRQQAAMVLYLGGIAYAENQKKKPSSGGPVFRNQTTETG